MSVKSSLESVIVYICPTLNKTFCILYFVVSALIDSEGECIAKSMSQEKTRSNHSKSPDSRVYIMSRNNKKHSQKSWVILLMNIHKPNRVIYDVSK